MFISEFGYNGAERRWMQRCASWWVMMPFESQRRQFSDHVHRLLYLQTCTFWCVTRCRSWRMASCFKRPSNKACRYTVDEVIWILTSILSHITAFQRLTEDFNQSYVNLLSRINELERRIRRGEAEMQSSDLLERTEGVLDQVEGDLIYILVL